MRYARLRRTPAAERRVAIVLSAYPTKRSRLGNAVGLDTPASAIGSARAPCATEGYRHRRRPADGDALMAGLADGLTYEAEALSPQQLAPAVGRLDGDRYAGWFAIAPRRRPPGGRAARGARRPGTHRIHDGALVFSGLDLGNVLVAIQPPRGLRRRPGRRVPLARTSRPRTTTSPSTAGSTRCGAPTPIVHLGKHGTLEWLPGQGARACRRAAGPTPRSATCPFFYPFVVNDPGEGAQAKRRAHAVVIDHLLPPMTRADTYDEIGAARAALRRVRAAAGARPVEAARPARADLGGCCSRRRDRPRPRPRRPRPTTTASTTCSSHVDGYLCELKDAQIRGGLHTLGAAPGGDDARRPRARRSRGSPHGQVPSLRATVAAELGLDPDDPLALDAVEARCRELVERRGRARLDADAGRRRLPTLRWVCDWLVPNLARTTDEIANLLHGLAGGHVPAGPSGALTRGGAHVLPTGRNFYSARPEGAPDRAVVGGRACKLADAAARAPPRRGGRLPAHRRPGAVGHRGHAHPGRRRRRGARAARRPPGVGGGVAAGSSGSRSIPLEELGRPRIDVTLRISGFFRDAFPNLVAPPRRRGRAGGVARRAGRAELRARRRRATTRASTAPAPAPTARASSRCSSSARGAPTTTSPRSTSRWSGLRVRPRRASACRPRPRCGAASPPSTWR